MADKRIPRLNKVDRVTIRLDRPTRLQVQRLAAASERPVSEWIRYVIRRAVEAA